MDGPRPLTALRLLVRTERRLRATGSLAGRWWGLVQPVAETAVFTAVFGVLFYLRGSPLEYVLFAYPGLLAWRIFARGVSAAAGSLPRHRALLHAYPVPAGLCPVATVADAWLAGLLGLPVLVGVLWVGGARPDLPGALAWLGAGLLLHAATTLGAALLAAVGGTLWRDVRSSVSPALAGLMFLTPVVWPPEILPAPVRDAALANPMAAAVECYREAFLGTGAAEPGHLWNATLVSAVLLVVGARLVHALDGRLREVV